MTRSELKGCRKVSTLFLSPAWHELGPKATWKPLPPHHYKRAGEGCPYFWSRYPHDRPSRRYRRAAGLQRHLRQQEAHRRNRAGRPALRPRYRHQRKAWRFVKGYAYDARHEANLQAPSKFHNYNPDTSVWKEMGLSAAELRALKLFHGKIPSRRVRIKQWLAEGVREISQHSPVMLHRPGNSGRVQRNLFAENPEGQSSCRRATRRSNSTQEVRERDQCDSEIVMDARKSRYGRERRTTTCPAERVVASRLVDPGVRVSLDSVTRGKTARKALAKRGCRGDRTHPVAATGTTPTSASRRWKHELKQYGVRARIELSFERHGHEQTWHGTITHHGEHFVQVRWDEGPQYDLRLPPPPSSGIVVLHLKPMRYASVLRQIAAEVKRLSIREVFDRWVLEDREVEIPAPLEGPPARDEPTQPKQDEKFFPRINPAFPGKGEPTLGGFEPTELTWIHTSWTSSVSIRTAEGCIRAPDERHHKNAGVLGTIVDNTVNLEEILKMDLSGEAAEVIDILMSASAFERHLHEGFTPQERISRFMKQHKERLVESDVVEDTGIDFGINYMPVFTVPKKDKSLRLIQDDRHLNRWFDKPPPMMLPRIHDVIDELMRNEYFAQCDARSWFYQIPLHPDTYKYFGAILGGGRGCLEYVVMKKLPMGFSWAPCVAQRISNVLVRGIGMAWVDNYLIMGTSLSEFHAHRKTFLDRISPVKANVVVDDDTLEPQRRGETLGIEINLRSKQYRMASSWAAKVGDAPTPSEWTPRTFTVAMGGIIWCSYVTRRGLCHYPHLMEALGGVMRAITKREVPWDGRCQLSDEAVQELVSAKQIIKDNVWIQWKERQPAEMEIWSDASDTHAAYLIVQHQQVIAALLRETTGEHIFLEELSIALDGIARAYSLGAESVKLFIDNAPAAGCIEKKCSTNFKANTWLRSAAPVQLDTQWVSTKYQLADPYTRGTSLPTIPCSTTTLPVYDTAITNSELCARGHHTFGKRRMCICDGECSVCHEQGNAPYTNT